MNAEPSRDDQYVELDDFPDEEVDLDLAGWAPTPELLDDAWEVIVASATHVDPEDLGVDVDALTGGPPDLNVEVGDEQDLARDADDPGGHSENGATWSPDADTLDAPDIEVDDHSGLNGDW